MANINEERLNKILQNFAHLEAKLSDPLIGNDPKNLQELSIERNRLAGVVEIIKIRNQLAVQFAEVQQQLETEKDQEFIAILKEEYPILQQKITENEDQLKMALLPKDPDAGKNLFLEIRAGTGGEEAALFARNLYRMYTRYFENIGMRYEIISQADTGLDGLKEIILLVKDERAFELLHLEGGGHRVQRIPLTESQGRIHTSACTVAVIPEVEESEININQNDLRIDVFRSSGAGGQHVNTTDSAVRITHLPTGLVVSCQDEKSQHKNKAKALKVLHIRLTELQREQAHEKMAADKKIQIGSGDRSQRIRTYNFPQNRITDHRINYTAYNLDKVIEGDLADLIENLRRHEIEEKLALQRTEGN